MQRRGNRAGVHRTGADGHSKVVKFVENSRESQTLFANIDYSFVAGVDEEHFLGDYIYQSIFFDKDTDFRAGADKEKIQTVDKIRREILTLGQTHSNDGQIELSTVWVHYLDHSTGTEEALPVFKIRKRKGLRQAFFLDVDLNVYHSWTHFIGEAKFPVSILCVPRNGEYTFAGGGDVLDLEYMCTARPVERSIPRPLEFRSHSEASRLLGLEKIFSLPEKILGTAMDFLATLRTCYNKYLKPVVDEIKSLPDEVRKGLGRSSDKLKKFAEEFVGRLVRRVRRLPRGTSENEDECSRAGDDFWKQDVVPYQESIVRTLIDDVRESLGKIGKTLPKKVSDILGQLVSGAKAFFEGAKVFWNANRAVLIRVILILVEGYASGGIKNWRLLLEVVGAIRFTVTDTGPREREMTPLEDNPDGQVGKGESAVPSGVADPPTEVRILVHLWKKGEWNWKQVLHQVSVILARHGPPLLEKLLVNPVIPLGVSSWLRVVVLLLRAVGLILDFLPRPEIPDLPGLEGGNVGQGMEMTKKSV